MQSKNIYFNYLEQRKAEPVGLMLSNASEACIELLSVIAVADFKGAPLTISQIMAMTQFASPGTIHRRVECLRQKGLIDLVFRNRNRRTKYIVPMPVAHAYFERMGELLVNAVTVSPVTEGHQAHDSAAMQAA